MNLSSCQFYLLFSSKYIILKKNRFVEFAVNWVILLAFQKLNRNLIRHSKRLSPLAFFRFLNCYDLSILLPNLINFALMMHFKCLFYMDDAITVNAIIISSVGLKQNLRSYSDKYVKIT